MSSYTTTIATTPKAPITLTAITGVLQGQLLMEALYLLNARCMFERFGPVRPVCYASCEATRVSSFIFVSAFCQ
jgi:hypothetical protein